jgi:4-diphosphocytidyl-2-C-methyl-D-erythritol kinase
MILFPNAKINLGLNITEKRTDGFHNIRSVFYPVPFYDVLEFRESAGFSLKILGKDVPGSEQENLVFKAWALMHEKYDIPPVEVYLLKNIPLGSGLGGGSADAAFMLKGLNDLFDLGCPVTELKGLALELGSDCPFFIENRPAFVSGRGEKVEVTALSLKGYFLVLVFPGSAVSTRNAYDRIIPKHVEISLNDLVAGKNFELWRKELVNDFEVLMPAELLMIKEKLYGAGALYASMTGSGSAFYGIFKEKPDNLKLDYETKVMELI